MAFVPGRYGSETEIPRITINRRGNIEDIDTVPAAKTDLSVIEQKLVTLDTSILAIKGSVDALTARVVLLEQAQPPPPPPPPPPPDIQPGDPRFGAVMVIGHDTQAIVDAVNRAMAATPTFESYRVVYFPRGTYASANPEFNNLHDLLFIGDGWDSIWQHVQDSDLPPATFTFCRNLAFRNMALDANGVTQYGPLKFYACFTVKVENVRFFDSRPRGTVGVNDRGAIGFYSTGVADPTHVNTDIYFAHNLVEDLEADFCNLRGAVIEYNISKRCPSTAAIGCFANNDGDVLENIIIRNNEIIDPYRTAIACDKDVWSVLNTRTKNIQIHDNHITWKKYNGTSVWVGTTNTLNDQPTDIFEDIVVVDNLMEYDPACPWPDGETAVVVFLACGFDTSFRFVRATISRNVLRGGGKAAGTWAFNLRGLADAQVEDNQVLDCGNGLSVSGRVTNTKVLRNTVKTGGYAYGFNNTWGGDVFSGNVYLVPPQPGLVFDGGNNAETDLIDLPIQVNS